MPDGTYHVPTHDECNQCHDRNKLQRDSLLGVEGVLLGLPTADGYTLAAMIAEGRLTVPPSRMQYQIPDDGTGKGSDALGYLHVNCGISCHNEDGSAYISHMYLRVYPSQLDDPSSAGWDILKNLLNVPPVTPNFGTAIRVVPGDPDDSLIVQLAGNRGSSRSMPPIGTSVVDDAGVQTLRDWIAAMHGDAGSADGGASADAGADAGTNLIADAGPTTVTDAGDATDAGAASADAGTVDSGDVDSGDIDAALDAQIDDAGTEDDAGTDADEMDAGATPAGDDAEVPDADATADADDAASTDDAESDGALADAEPDADESDGA